MSDLGLDLLFRRRVTGNNNIVVSYTPDEEDRSKLWFGMAVCVCAPAALLNKGTSTAAKFTQHFTKL